MFQKMRVSHLAFATAAAVVELRSRLLQLRRSAARCPGRCRSFPPTTGGTSTSPPRRSIPLRRTTSRSSTTAARRLHPDFGGDVSPGSVQIYGFPYVVVDGTTAEDAPCSSSTRDESDGVNHTTDQSFPFYPIPDEAITQPHWIEGGDPGNVDLRIGSDRHLLIVDRDNRHLYELYNVFYDGAQWHAGSGAFFDLNANGRRPDGWTSADAAGLAILPGLVRYDEVFGPDEISHAFRVTVRATNGYVYPASHRAGSTAGALPMGARLRLKASANLSRLPGRSCRRSSARCSATG